jgi:hypothetical protein
MNRVLVVLAAIGVAIGAAYFAGYWPQRQGRVASEAALEATRAELESMRADLQRAQARNRLYALQSRLVVLINTVEARNFGDAQAQGTAFFDAVQVEAGRPDQSHARRELDAIVAGRDALTVALTRNDPVALQMLQGAMIGLREGLVEAPRPQTVASSSHAGTLPGQ